MGFGLNSSSCQAVSVNEAGVSDVELGSCGVVGIVREDWG